jgi:hypothetical protein
LGREARLTVWKEIFPVVFDIYLSISIYDFAGPFELQGKNVLKTDKPAANLC